MKQTTQRTLLPATMAMTLENMQELMAKLVEQVTKLAETSTTAENKEDAEGTNSKKDEPRKEGSPKLDLKNFTRMEKFT